MPCIFCRSNFHTKSNCVDPSTRETENSIMSCIRRSYIVSYQFHLTYDEFNESMKIILTALYKVIEIKMAIEYIKKRTGHRYNSTTNKTGLIRILVEATIVMYDYVFDVPSPDHILNSHRLTSGIISLTRLILHPQVGNLQPRIVNRSNQREDRNNWVPRNVRPVTFNPSAVITTYTVHKSTKQCNDSTDCPVCFNGINDNTYVYFQCFHEFCKNCVKECLLKNILNCPLCRDPITKIYTQHTL